MARVTKMVSQIGDALRSLNPKDVRAMADRPLVVELASTTEEGYMEMARYLISTDVSDEKRTLLRKVLFRAGNAPRDPDLRIAHISASPFDRNTFIYNPAKPEQMVCDVLDAREELHI